MKKKCKKDECRFKSKEKLGFREGERFKEGYQYILLPQNENRFDGTIGIHGKVLHVCLQNTSQGLQKVCVPCSLNQLCKEKHTK